MPRPGQPWEEGLASPRMSQKLRDLVRAGTGRLGATLSASLGVVQRAAGLGECARSGEAQESSLSMEVGS